MIQILFQMALLTQPDAKKCKCVEVIINSLQLRDKANSQKWALVIVTNIYFKETYNSNWFSFVDLDKKWIVGSSFKKLLLKNDLLYLIKLGDEHFSLLFVSKLNTDLEQSCGTPQGLQYPYSYKSGIYLFLNKDEFPKLLSACSPLDSLTDTAKSSLKKHIFPISKQNIDKSVTNRKSNTRIKIPGNLMEHFQPITFLKFLVKSLNLFLLPLVNHLKKLLKFHM